MKKLVFVLLVLVVFLAGFSLFQQKKLSSLAKEIKTKADQESVDQLEKTVANNTDYIFQNHIQIGKNMDAIEIIDLSNTAEIGLLQAQTEILAGMVNINTENINILEANVNGLNIFVYRLGQAAAQDISQLEAELKNEIAMVDIKASASLRLLKEHGGKRVWIFWLHDKEMKESAELIQEFLKYFKELEKQNKNKQ